VRTEWPLLMATHNLTKLHRHQIATQGTRNGPSGGDTADHDEPVTNTAHTTERRRWAPRPLSDSVPGGACAATPEG
jgi:hypothetical protein